MNEAKRRAQRRPPQGQVVSLDQEPGRRGAGLERRPRSCARSGATCDGSWNGRCERCPPGYRAPLILRDVEGLSTAEAAEMLDLGEAAFKSRLHSARLAVRRTLDEYFLQAGGGAA